MLDVYWNAHTVPYQAHYKNKAIGFQKTNIGTFQIRVILAYRRSFGAARSAINVAQELRLPMLILFLACRISLNLKSETKMAFQEVRNFLYAYLPSNFIGKVLDLRASDDQD